jgi:hypothetical protein
MLMQMTVQEIKQRIDHTEQRTLPVYNERPRYLEEREAQQGGPLQGVSALANMDARRLSLGLGWFSIGLGLAQVAAPQLVAQLSGIEDSRDSRSVMSALGLREIANGLAILAQPQNPLWLQTRIAGDVMDLALLGIAFGGQKNDQAKVAAAIGAVAGIAALDVLGSIQLSGETRD